MRNTLMLSMAAALLSLAFGATAAPLGKEVSQARTAVSHCRDKSGKFVSCSVKSSPKQCRNAAGKFKACPK